MKQTFPKEHFNSLRQCAVIMYKNLSSWVKLKKYVVFQIFLPSHKQNIYNVFMRNTISEYVKTP